jgi:isoleucyl-tRNA synthetase
MSIDFPKAEEAIIQRWREIKAFERQVRTLELPSTPNGSFVWMLISAAG